MSTGFRALAYPGSSARNSACRDSLSSGTAHLGPRRRAGQPALRRCRRSWSPPQPAARGAANGRTAPRRVSRTCSPVRTRTTPACSSAASRTASPVASAAVCDIAPRRPAPSAPADGRLDRRCPSCLGEELAGVGNRLKQQVDVRRHRVIAEIGEQFRVGDVSLVGCREHLRDTQRLVLAERVHRHPVRPGLGDDGDPAAAARAPAAIDAFKGRSASYMPKQLGPTSRTPGPRSGDRLAGPVSANPALRTTTAATPLPVAARTISGMVAAGVAMTARSTSPETSHRSA